MGPWDGLVTSVGAELVGVVELIEIQPTCTDCMTDLQHWAPLHLEGYAYSNLEIFLQKLRRGEKAASEQVPSVVDKRRSARRWAAPYGRLAIAVGPPRGSREYTHAREAAVQAAWCFISVWVGISVGVGVGMSSDSSCLQACQRRGVKTLAQIALSLEPSAMTPSSYLLATVSQDGALPYDPNGRAGSRDTAVLRARAPWRGAKDFMICSSPEGSGRGGPPWYLEVGRCPKSTSRSDKVEQQRCGCEEL